MRQVKRISLMTCLALTLGQATPIMGQSVEGAQTHVVVAERSEVRGRTIRLGDIARITSEEQELVDKLSRIEIQNAPPPGQTLTVDPNLIRTRLRQARLDVRQIQLLVPPKILVVAQAQVVSRAAIVEAAKEYLRSQPAWAGKEVVIDDPQFVSDVVVPPGEVAFKVTNPQPNHRLPSSLVRVGVDVDGEEVRAFNLFLKVHVFADVAVAARSMRWRDTMTEGDVKMERRDLSSLPADVCLDVQEVIGKRLTRVVVKGQPLTHTMLEPPPAVSAGSKVKVIALIGQVKIILIAEAREDGWLGKTILVRNLDSRKTFYAEVVDEGTAVVRF